MYSKIVCNKEHKKCVILKKTKEKLANAKTTVLRVACVGGVFIVLASFVACSGAKEISNNIESTNPKIETTLNQDKTTTKYEIQTTENVQQSTTGAPEITIVQTTAPPSITEEQKTTVKQTTQATTQPTTQKEETKVVTMEPTIEIYSKARFSKILEKINKVLDKKDFSNLAKQFIREGVEQIYNNYGEWHSVYKDLPTIEEYIDGTIIPGIKNSGSIEMIDRNSKKAKNMLNEGSAAAATRGDNCDVYLIYNDPKTCSEEEHLEDLELLFHELSHCKDKKVLFKEDNFEEDEEIAAIYKEGAATFDMKLMNPLTPDNTVKACVYNSTEDKSVEYGKDNGLGYLLNLYIYENFVYLAGYNTVEQVGQGQDISIIKDAIGKKYGEDLANSIWVDYYNLYCGYQYGSDSDTFKTAINLQNSFFECIKQDIQNLDTTNKDEVRRFMDVYRNYKIKIMPQVLKNDFDNITKKFFDTDSLDDLLIQKIEESKAVKPFSKNKYLNRMALKSILFADNNNYGDYDQVFVPSTISGTKYSYFESDNKGHMIMTYKNKEGRETEMQIDFDEERITNVGESNGIEAIIRESGVER